MPSTRLAHRLSLLLPAILALAACDRTPQAATRTAPAVTHEASRDEEAGVVPAAVAPAPHIAPSPVLLATTTRAAVATPSPRDPATLLTLRRAVVARDVVDHEPVGAGDAFAAEDTSQLFVFLDVRNDSAASAELTVSFVRTDVADGRERGGVTLLVPAAARRFRTWAYTRQVHAPGAWTAIVRDEDGHVVTRLPFVVGA